MTIFTSVILINRKIKKQKQIFIYVTYFRSPICCTVFKKSLKTKKISFYNAHIENERVFLKIKFNKLNVTYQNH